MLSITQGCSCRVRGRLLLVKQPAYRLVRIQLTDGDRQQWYTPRCGSDAGASQECKAAVQLLTSAAAGAGRSPRSGRVAQSKLGMSSYEYPFTPLYAYHAMRTL